MSTGPRRTASAIVEWWKTSALALRHMRDAIANGWLPPSEHRQLIAMTSDEREMFFDAELAETRLLALFAVYSTADAVFMDDLDARVRGRKSDPMVKRLRSLKRRAARQPKGFRITLDHVLHEWRLARPDAKKDLDWFASEVEHRHRLAHGRSGARPSHDPDLLSQRLSELFKRLGLSGWS